MKTRLLILAAILLLLALAAYYLMPQKTPAPGIFIPKPAPAPTLVFPQGKLDQDSFINQLDDRAFAAVVINPRRFESPLEHLDAFWKRLSATSAWSKLNIEQILKDLPAASESEQGAGLAAIVGNLPQTAQLIAKWWNGIDEIGLATSAPGFEASAETRVPGLFLRARFSNPDLLSELAALIDGGILNGEDSTDFGFVTLRRQEAEAGTQQNIYQAVFKVDGPQEVKASLTLKAPYASLSLPEETSPSADRPPFTDSSEWPAMAQGLTPDAACFMGIRIKPAELFAQNLLKLASGAGADPSLEAAQGMLRSSFDQFESIAISAAFPKGMVLRHCVNFAPNATSLNVFKSFVKAKESSKSSLFFRLLTPQTVLALSSSKHALELWFESVKENYAVQLSAINEQTAEWQRFAGQLETLERILKNLSVDQIGLLVDLSPPFMLPEFAVLLSGAKKPSLNHLAQSFNDAMAALSAFGLRSDLPVAQVRAEGSGEKIQLELGPAKTVSAVPIGDNAVIASTSQLMIENSAKLIRQEGGLLENLLAKDAAWLSQVETSDLSIFLNSASAVTALKMFLPLLQAIKPELNLSAAEFNEFLGLLEFTALFYQHSYLSGERNMCGEAKTFVF